MSTPNLGVSHLETWGPSSGAPRALLLHGITSSGRTWWQIAEALAAAGWSVTAPDLRGHGRSGRPGEYRFDDFADDVMAIGTSWELVVAHSLGGAITVTVLLRDPGFARRAVLIDPALRLAPGAAGTFLATTLEELATADEATIRAQHPRWHPRTVQARLDSYREVDPDAVRAILTQNDPWDLEEIAAEVSTPVHVIAADPTLGSTFPAELGEHLRAVNPRWSYEVIIGATHSVHRDEPDLVIGRLLAG